MKYIVICLISVFPGVWFGEDPVVLHSFTACKTAAITKAEETAPHFGTDVEIGCGCMSTETAINKGYLKRDELKRSTPGSI